VFNFLQRYVGTGTSRLTIITLLTTHIYRTVKIETKLTKSLKDEGEKKALYTITDENIQINIFLIA